VRLVGSTKNKKDRGLEETHVFNRFAKVLLSVTAVLIGMWVSVAVAQTPEKKPEWKDGQAEYTLYEAANKATDPAKRLAALDAWKAKYPESDFNDMRLASYLATYQQLNQPAKMAETAKQIMAKDPKDIRALLTLTQLTRTLPPTPDSLETGAKAAQALLDSPKPSAVPDEETWKKAKATEAYATLAFIDLQKKQPEAAEEEYKKWLAVDPNNAFASYSLANTILSEKKVERYPEMLYHFARAASLTGPGALPEQLRQKADGTLIKAYNTFHGSDDAGLKELRTLAIAQPMPPAGFKILDKNEIAASNQAKMAADNPQLALWKNIKDQLTAADGETYFNEKLKGTAPPKLRGKLVSTKPAIRPKELVLDLEGGNTPEVTLKLETPLPGKAEPGTEIQFEGIPSAFTKEPFMLTFDVDSKDKIQGWPAQAAPPAKKRVVPRKKTQ
jgi:tetratricopeptide (TPR) repeat protein